MLKDYNHRETVKSVMWTGSNLNDLSDITEGKWYDLDKQGGLVLTNPVIGRTPVPVGNFLYRGDDKVVRTLSEHAFHYKFICTHRN